MKAAQVTAYGGPGRLVINEVDKPAVVPGSVCVEVRAASLNPFDTKFREGAYKDSIPMQLPFTLGGDIAGVVTEVGEGVESLAEGDEVYGQANAAAGNSGAFAEYAVTKAEQVAKKPQSLSFEAAAALPLTGVSALQALTEHINLQSGQKILIHGGSGGIGTMAVQIAKHLGAYVAATVPAEAVDYARGLGADEVIDFTAQRFEEVIRDYDAVFDTAGGDVFEKSLAVVKPGAVLVSMAASIDEAKAAGRGVTVIAQNTRVNMDKLDKLARLVEEGVIKVHVDRSFPLEQIQAAFKERENGTTRGKIVITVQ